MKRFNQLVLFYVLLFSSAIFIQSCCNEPDLHTITGEGQILFSELTVPSAIPDTLTGTFSIYIEPEVDITDTWQDLGLVNSALAISCDVEYVNRIEENTIELTLDQEIILAGETIASGENLIGLEGVAFILSEADLIILFQQLFIDNVEMIPGEYEFSLQMSTNDEVELKSVASIEVDLQ